MNLLPALPEKYRGLSSKELSALRWKMVAQMSRKEQWQVMLIQILSLVAASILGSLSYALYRDFFGGRHLFVPMGIIVFIQGIVVFFWMRWLTLRLLAKRFDSADDSPGCPPETQSTPEMGQR